MSSRVCVPCLRLSVDSYERLCLNSHEYMKCQDVFLQRRTLIKKRFGGRGAAADAIADDTDGADDLKAL